VTPKSESAALRDRESIEQRIVRRLGARTVVMVGMMGAGKSSIGRRLAARLGLAFADADTEIELAANETIPDIFERYGEAYFRDGERRVIKRLLDDGPKVLATGGGAFIQPETRADIQSKGIAVWLKADQEVLMARVKRRSNRPLLRTDDPEATMTRLIAERYPIYAEAPIQVQSRDVSHDVVLDDILGALDDYLAIAPQEAGIHG
jgi:shikimate kinase